MPYKFTLTSENNTYTLSYKGITKILEPTDLHNEYYTEFDIENTTLCIFYKPNEKPFAQKEYIMIDGTTHFHNVPITIS